MKATYLPFNSQADGIIGDIGQRSKIIAAAIAKAVSDLTQLPTSQVESPASFFNMQVMPQARIAVSQWNENIVFDARACLDFLRAFWLLRYNAAHPVARPVYSMEYGFIDSIVGAPTYFSPEQLSFLNEHKSAIIMLSASAAIVTFELQQGDSNG